MLYQRFQNRLYTVTVAAVALMVLSSCANPPGLVGHYAFSGDALDASGFGNHGTAIGVVSTTDRDDVANNAYELDGQEGHILIPNSASLSISNFQDGYSVAAWVFPNDVSSVYRDIVSKGNNAFSIRLNRELLEACHHEVNSTGCQVANIRIPQGEWSHIAVTWDQSTGKWQMYHNGDPANYTGNMQTLVTSSEGNVAIGKDPWYDRWYFDGKIDDIRIYNREIQISEIRDLAAPVCVPKTCADIGSVCGTGVDDGCGGEVSCGSCGADLLNSGQYSSCSGKYVARLNCSCNWYPGCSGGDCDCFAAESCGADPATSCGNTTNIRGLHSEDLPLLLLDFACGAGSCGGEVNNNCTCSPP